MKAVKPQNIALVGVGDIGNNTVNLLHAQQLKNVLLAVSNADAPGSVQTAMRDLLANSPEMVFVVASLDGAEANKAVTVAAKAKASGVLTVAFVGMSQSQTPEDQAKKQLMLTNMKQHTDATFVIDYGKLRAQYGAAEYTIAKASEYVANVVQGITCILTIEAEVNVDILDVRTVLERADKAVIGNAIANGQNRAMEAVQRATDFSFLNHADMAGAGRILLSITSGISAELEMEELTEITEYIQDKAGQQAEVIFGHGFNDRLQDSIQVTLIAACFSDN